MNDLLLAQLTLIEEYFGRSTRALTEEDSQFAPHPGMFTAAQQIAHTAQTIEWFVDGAFAPGGFSMDFETAEKEVRAVTSLEAARTWMARACTHARAALASHSAEEWNTPLPPGPIMGGAPRSAIFSSIADHTAHHRGALTVYTRLRGKVPPMPYMDI